MNFLNYEEQAAVSLAGLAAGKRERDSPDIAGGCGKKARPEEAAPPVAPEPVALAVAPEIAAAPAPNEDLKPFPFFFYKDFSQQKDPDSLTPLTAPGRVPNFPAKMHAILSRPDLADVISWMPHGRSWKVLKPREFEIRVIPTYFEHAKFSSFIRQANGWGFRRITTGKDRNSYYHPLFLRSLPHLCKDMKRPGVAKKLAADPEHEPDLYRISDLFPVPAKPVDNSILLQCTLQGGPKARMPIYSGSLSNTFGSIASASSTTTNAANATGASLDLSAVSMAPADRKKLMAASLTAPAARQLTPRDQEAMSSFQASLGASHMFQQPTPAMSYQQPQTSAQAAPPVAPQPNFMLPQPNALMNMVPASSSNNNSSSTSTSTVPSSDKVSPLMAANQMAFANPSSLAAAFQASSAATQFAAGFAAAAALSHQQFQNMLAQAGTSFAAPIIDSSSTTPALVAGAPQAVAVAAAPMPAVPTLPAEAEPEPL